MSKTKESAISTLSASEFFKRLDLSKLDPNTANYIRQEILSFQNINMLDGTPEFDAVREMVEENYPQALGIIPVPDKDIESKKTEPKEITGKVNKKEQQRLEKEQKEAAKKKHKEEVEEIEGLIELMEDTVKGNPNDTDSKDYLELLQDTIKELRKKKFEEGGEVGDDDDDSKLEYISELIKKGNTSGYDPYWKLSIEFDGEIDDDDRSNISHLVKNGFTSGEIVSGEESQRGWWSIDIGESMAKGGGVITYAVVDDDTDRIYVKNTDKDFIDKKHKELKEVYPNNKLSIVEFNGGNKLSDNDYFQVVNNFVYFCLNYPKNFFDAFGDKDDMIRKHIESKFNKAYDNHGSYGAMVYFWTDLDGNNKKKLAEWIKQNYKGQKLDYSGDTTGIIDHFVYFTQNHPNNFIDAFSSQKEHIQNKFNSYYEKYGSWGVMIKFWSELDAENQKDFAKWIKENYTGHSLRYDKGGDVGENYEIEIIENSDKKRRWKGVVSKSIYDAIEESKNQGGFRRYDVDLYDDNSAIPLNNNGLYEFMNSIGVKWQKTLPTVDPKRVERTNWNEGGEFNNKDLLPPAGKYSEYLQLASSKLGISIDEARSKYGQYTISQWEELLGGGEDKNALLAKMNELAKNKYGKDYTLISHEKASGQIPEYYELYKRYKKLENGGGIGSEKEIKERLEYLRGELRAEKISQGELIELQSLAKYIDPSDVELLEAAGVPEHGNDPELEGKYVYKFHEERGELSAYVENMATGEEVWSFKYPDYSLPEEEREFQSTPVSDGFMRHWEDINGLENYLKDLSVLPDGSELMSEEKANNLGYYKDGGGLKKWYAKGGGIDNPTIKKIHNAILDKRPSNYSELIDVVNSLTLPSYGWNANNVYYMGAYQGVRLFVHDSKQKKYELPSKTEVYAIKEHEGLNRINSNKEGKEIKHDGGSISDHYEQVNDLFVDKKTFAVTTREDVKVHQGTSFEDALKWAKDQYEKKSGGVVAEATETFVIGDILQNKKHPHIYVTLITEKSVGGTGKLFNAYESDKKGKGVTEGNWVRSVWDWDFKDWDKVGHVNLKQVEKKSDDKTYSYYKSGNKQIDTYLSLFDDRYQFFVNNAPKPLKNLRDKLQDDNHHYATATLVSDFFNDPKKNKVTQYKFKKGGKIEKEFIEKVKSIHNQMKEVTLKDGTKIDAKDLMADGGALKNKERVEIVLKHYLIAALWSSTDSDNEDQPFDSEYDIEDFDKKSVDKARKLIIKFMMDNEADLKASGLNDEQIGHDLWLTQVGHGAGFWDRGLDKELGDRLSKAAKTLGQSATLFAEKGKVYIESLNDVDEMKRGGKLWIKDALSGGKNKGALRRTAMRKGLLRNEKENLSKTDLHKLEKMGGTTAKRAYMAETLSKFDTGGSVDWSDLSAIVPSAIKMEEKNAGQGNAELILTSNGKVIAKFWFNMRGYNPDFSMKNKDGVYYELGSDKPKATQFSNFKKALREGYTLIKH